MSDLFAPKEIIPPGYQQLEILSVEKTEQYGPQVAFKDKDTGQIKQGTKAWGIYAACLGPDFHKKITGMDAIVGKQYVAKVEQTKTGSRNKTEFGTAGPVPAGGFDGGDDIEPPDFSS